MKLSCDLFYLFPSKQKFIRWIETRNSLFLLNPKKHKYFKLNELGAYIWNICDGSKSVKQINDAIVKNFLVDKKQTTIDLTRFLNNIKQKGLIQFYKSRVGIKE